MSYIYVCRMRPPAPGAVPMHGLIDVDYDLIWYKGKQCWGSVRYDRKLSEKELEVFELAYLGNTEEFGGEESE